MCEKCIGTFANPDLMTVAQAAEQAGCSAPTIRNWIAAGTLLFFKVRRPGNIKPIMMIDPEDLRDSLAIRYGDIDK